MPVGPTFRREMRVALSRKAQPVWFRVLKWVGIVALAVYFWASPRFWLYVAIAFVLGLVIHLFWRWKTKGWTQPWGGWNDVDTANREKR